MTFHIRSVSQTWQQLRGNPVLWLRPLLVAGLLLFSIALPFLPARRYHIYLLGLVPGIVAVLAFLRWPPLGLIALIFAGMFIPFGVGTGTQSAINVSVLLILLLLGLWLLELISARSSLGFVAARVEKPLLALILVAVLSFIAGHLPWLAFAERMAPLDAQIAGLFIYVLAVGVLLLTAHRVSDLRWLQWITWTFVAVGALYVAALMLPGIGPAITRFYQPGTYDNSMFWTWLVAIALSQAAFNRRLHLGWRFVLAALVAATFYAAYFINGDWKSGWLPPIAVAAVIIGLRSWRLGLVLALGGLVFVPEIVPKIIASDAYSYSSRLDAWLVMLQLIKANPVFGFGPANYYFYTRLFNLMGYTVRFNSHNQYLDIVAQVGLLGLTAFLWFIAEVARLAWQLRNEVEEGFARAYIYGVLGGLAGMMVAGMLVDWILPFVYNIGLTGFKTTVLAWMFIGGLLSINHIARRQTPA